MDKAKEMHRVEDQSAKPPKTRVRGKDSATKDIIDYLDANDAGLPEDIGLHEANEAVIHAVNKLYEAYGRDGIVPTREAFAEQCEHKDVGKAVLAMPYDPFVARPIGRKAVAAICAGCALAVALIGFGVASTLTATSGGSGVAPDNVTIETNETEAVDPQEAFVLDIGVSAKDYDKDLSSPVIVHVENKDEGVDYYHAYDANEGYQLTVPAEGEYQVSFISPVNSDGSIYRVPEQTTVSAVPVDDDSAGSSGGTSLPFEFEKVDAEDVTSEELTVIVEQVADAVEKGDETLTGESGVGVVEKVEENVTANPNADTEKVEETADSAAESAESGESAATGAPSNSGSSSGGTSKPSSGSSSSGSSGSSGSTSSGSSSSSGSSNSGSKPSGNSSGSSSSGSSTSSGGASKPSSGSSSGSSNSGSSSGSSSASGSGSSSGSKPSHTHNWVAQTKTVHHEAEYKTVHHDAEYKTVHHEAVTKGVCVCNGCGAQFDTVELWGDHTYSQLLSGHLECGSYYPATVVTQQAYDEQVLVNAAWDEQVLVQAAWDETVTTGYTCSGCGATK